MDQQTLDILLIDDDEFFANVVANQLRDEFHYKVTVANTGQMAKTLLENRNSLFDIILTDYSMPEMNGIDLLQWIHDRNIETPVVMLTAAGSDIVAVDAMKLGAYDYVRKEQLDLHHLGVVINATHERYQFRITKALEEERAREIGLNKQATDKVRDVLNKLTPTLNSALANIIGDIESKGEEICKHLPVPQKSELRTLLDQIKREADILENSIRGLLDLYRILYAHHAEAQELERLKREIEGKVAST
jgi:CheY-like chemotaxis protein